MIHILEALTSAPFKVPSPALLPLSISVSELSSSLFPHSSSWSLTGMTALYPYCAVRRPLGRPVPTGTPLAFHSWPVPRAISSVIGKSFQPGTCDSVPPVQIPACRLGVLGIARATLGPKTLNGHG